MKLPELEKLFPYEYKSCGYFRLKGVPKKIAAPILHGEESIRFIYNKIQKILNQDNE